MLHEGKDNVRQARAFVFGFACNQGFLFSLFYLGSNRAVGVYPYLFERAELFGMLFFVTFALVFLRSVSASVRNRLFGRPALWVYAVLLVAGSFVSELTSDLQLAGFAAESVFVGVPFGFTLALWGRVLGNWPIDKSVPAVFIASALGGAICFICACIPLSQTSYALHLLPFGSAFALWFLLKPAPARDESHEDAREDAHVPYLTPGPLFSTDAPSRISLKIVAGTTVFGIAAGFMEIYGSDPGMATTPTFPVTLFLFVLFCVAALQLFGGEGAQKSSLAREDSWAPSLFARLTKQGAREPEHALQEQGPLDSTYRLALLLMMAGFLFVPVLGEFNVPGEAIVLAGYLGLMAVLVSLFLVMGHVAEQDTALSFARGFTALFAGEMVGLALGNAIEMGNGYANTPYVVVACAGLAVLYSYLFLFTESDFRALSIAVRETDRFEEVCARLVAERKLTNREADILPFALKGRTNERIATELCVAKSTIDTHIRHIYAKCGVHNRQELIDLGETLQRR